jgi:hypothetical protein
MCAPVELTCGAEGDVHGEEPTCGYTEPRGGRSRAWRGRAGVHVCQGSLGGSITLGDE